MIKRKALVALAVLSVCPLIMFANGKKDTQPAAASTK